MNLEIYQSLYQAVEYYEKIQPWQLFYNGRCIKIINGDQILYCSIVNQHTEHIGFSIYQQEEGLKDLLSLNDQYPEGVEKYVFYDQSCITLYFGDRDEVPEQQLRMMEELQIRFTGRGAYPYFYSLKPHYFPYAINDEEAKLLCDVTNLLCNAFEVIEEADVDEEELLEITVLEDGYKVRGAAMPDLIEKYQPFALDIPEILDHIGMGEPTDQRIMIDLVYAGTPFELEGDRPINPLIGLVVDEDQKSVVGHYLVEVDDDEVSVVISLLCAYVSKFGRPAEILVRNPRVYEALVYVCDSCEIELVVSDYTITDEIIENMNLGE